MNSKLLDEAIYKVRDFPKKGVLFYDITGILARPEVFSAIIDEYYERYAHENLEAIATIDSRGFIFAAPVAYRLKVPLLLIRKSGKLPRKTESIKFDLEYASSEVELNPDDVRKGKIVLFDDLLATGGTARASCELLEKNGAEIFEIASIIALDFLPYAEVLKKYKLHFLISYSTERYLA